MGARKLSGGGVCVCVCMCVYVCVCLCARLNDSQWQRFTSHIPVWGIKYFQTCKEQCRKFQHLLHHLSRPNVISLHIALWLECPVIVKSNITYAVARAIFFNS